MQRRWKRGSAVAALLLVVVGVAAFGASAKGPATTPEGVPIGKACGQVPPASTPAAVRSLPAAIKSQYLGYPYKVLKSAYASWKPKHAPPYTVAIDYGPLINPWNAYVYNLLPKFLKRSPLVKNVITVTRRSNTDPTESLQTYNSMVQQKPDIILVLEGLTSVAKPAIEAAGKSGIPTISMINDFESPYTVSVVPNSFVGVGETAATILKTLGTANVLFIHAIPGQSSDINTLNAFKAVLANCPGSKIVGEINGFYSPPATKGATLQFLATHPEPINYVATGCCMSIYAVQAFQQAGRPLPAASEVSALKAELGFWNQNKANYKAAVTIGGGTSFADLVVKTTLRMLAGQGPKFSSIVWPAPLVTSANLSKYAKPDWTIDTPGTVDNKPVFSDKQLNAFFTNTGITKGIDY